VWAIVCCFIIFTKDVSGWWVIVPIMCMNNIRVKK
jgi:hypothetical protein